MTFSEFRGTDNAPGVSKQHRFTRMVCSLSRAIRRVRDAVNALVLGSGLEVFSVSFKSLALVVALGMLTVGDAEGQQIGRETTMQEADDPAVFQDYQRRMVLRRVARSPRLRDFYLSLYNDPSRKINRIGDGGRGHWHGWTWVAPGVASDGSFAPGHYEKLR